MKLHQKPLEQPFHLCYGLSEKEIMGAGQRMLIANRSNY